MLDRAPFKGFYLYISLVCGHRFIPTGNFYSRNQTFKGYVSLFLDQHLTASRFNNKKLIWARKITDSFILRQLERKLTYLS